jgi:hypothetical protein
MPGVYYIPTKQNQVGLDAFIVYQGILYVFQFTCGHGHGIKDGMLHFLAKCAGLPSREHWRFVFVIPDAGEVLTCPVPHLEELQELRLHSSIVTVEMEEERQVPPLGMAERAQAPLPPAATAAHRRVLSGSDNHIAVIVQKSIRSSASSFRDFFAPATTFVDKTLVIEAFLRNGPSHHLVLRPRRCGKSFTLSMLR